MLIHIEKYIWIFCFCLLSVSCITGCAKRARRRVRRIETSENYFEQYPENWSNSGE
jgi:hypothetical protein